MVAHDVYGRQSNKIRIIRWNVIQSDANLHEVLCCLLLSVHCVCPKFLYSVAEPLLYFPFVHHGDKGKSQEFCKFGYITTHQK